MFGLNRLITVQHCTVVMHVKPTFAAPHAFPSPHSVASADSLGTNSFLFDRIALSECAGFSDRHREMLVGEVIVQQYVQVFARVARKNKLVWKIECVKQLIWLLIFLHA